MRTILFLLAGITVASAADCPPEKPIKKFMVDYPTTVIAVYCTPKIICPDNTNLCTSGPNPNCNRYQGPSVTEMCFSKEEIEQAK